MGPRKSGKNILPPIPNKKRLRYVPKEGKASYGRVRGANKFKVKILKDKYIKLYKKAKKECNTATPVQDILELLAEYYIENRFVIHRQILSVDDPTLPDDVLKNRQKLYLSKGGEKAVDIWMELTNYKNNMLSLRMKRDGISINYLLDLLVDFYLDNRFIVKTKIIRTTPYRTGGSKDVELFRNKAKEKKVLTRDRERFITVGRKSKADG